MYIDVHIVENGLTYGHNSVDLDVKLDDLIEFLCTYL